MNSHRERPTSRVRLFAVTAVLLLAGACNGDNEEAEPAPTPTPNAVQSPAPDATPGSDAARTRVEIELIDNEYVPDEVTVPAGEIVTFLLDNTGDNGHTFTIDERDLDVEIQFGASSRVDLPFEEPGEVEFYCRFHRDVGMTGTINVQ